MSVTWQLNFDRKNLLVYVRFKRCIDKFIGKVKKEIIQKINLDKRNIYLH